ncbi:pyruvate kinase [Ciceribacter sp. L1K23]|uniref:pyruvate kinase n=1 Tax=Ciceribacter sp. L1K23 TaxID=2820276 RepID=UPI001B82C6F9|nr:pyruvate kinase [Ciceribacter sp. L1K23]MBR0557239.1 pyruvate kinase [Ciceribacter sp. L1K23]
MNQQANHDAAMEASVLLDEVLALRAKVVEEVAGAGLVDGGEDDAAVRNLRHYLALRHHDIRDLQRRLMPLGLSSLGRLESRVLPTLDAVAATLAAMVGRGAAGGWPATSEFFGGEMRLSEMASRLLGEARTNRRTRIMVTLPGDAAERPEFLPDLARRGMDVARVNCAHDEPEAWRTMALHVRAAGRAVGRDIKVLMDIAGPKIRTSAVAAPDKKARLQAGDRLRLVATGLPRPCADVTFSAGVSLPELVTRLSVGDRVRYDDGKLEGVVEDVSDGEAVIRVVKTKAGGAKLKPEKGLNLPDTALGLSPLTTKDEADLATVIECADMLGYSFVSRPDDIDLLEDILDRLGADHQRLGLIAKIEQPDAVKNLPALIARARQRGPFGVMIARGDLAAEIGFERLAEMQEEILWLCEAASVPVVWATQVLEDLVKEGIPSRAEMTDAAMAARAECVMLNKGPLVTEAVSVLDTLLGRMENHILKKTPQLRALTSW